MLKNTLGAGLVALAVASGGQTAWAVVVADLGTNYQAAALGQTSSTINAGAGIADSSGLGRWNYLQANAGGGGATLLTFQSNPGNSGLPAYAGSVAASESGFAMPALSKTIIFGDGVPPVADAVNVHPGNENPSEVIARWTVGKAGVYNLAGAVTDVLPSGNGVTSVMRINGVDQSLPEITISGRETGFNFLRTLNVGDTVEVAVGANSGFGADESAVRFRATQLEGRLLANVGGDYRPASAGQTSATINIQDTAGQGTWRYFGSDNINIDATAGEQLGVFNVVGDAGNSGYGGGLNGFNMSAVSDVRLFGNGEAPLDDELALHPADSTRVFEVLRWTAGAGEAGLVNVVGNIRKTLIGGDGIDFHILVNGVELFTAVSATSVQPMTFFDFSTTIAVGSTIDFVLGRRGGFGADESILSAFIVQAPVVPEPATALLGVLAAGMLGFGRRRRA